MAYAFIITAIRPELYSTFLSNLDLNKPLPSLHAEKFVITTHYYLSAGTGDQNLNIAMVDLLETGQEIHEAYWHPFRLPLYHDYQTIKVKSEVFKNSYNEMIYKLSKEDAESWDMDFLPIIDLLDFAVDNNLSLLTFLEKPQDKERADKVYYPVDLSRAPL